MLETKRYVDLPDESDELDDYSDDDLYNIESWGADLSFRELITMYDEGELIKPELQRQYVWDKSEASRFIESLLLGLPVPSIFLAKKNNEQKLIIDGYQRIMTVYEFVVKRVFSKDGKAFKLSSSKRINERWRGKSFDELSDIDQRKIKSTTIHAIIFQQKEPRDGDTSLFQVFERINTSGRTLTSQEIRNCVYQGRFNDLLFELNGLEHWRKLYGDNKPDARMKDMEFILRYFALLDNSNVDTSKSSISLKKTLNEVMGDEEENTVESIDIKRNNFIEVMDFIVENIGTDAFFNVSAAGKTIPKLHPTVFDSIAIATYKYLKSNNKEIMPVNLSSKRLLLLQDEGFKTFTTIRTTNTDHIKGRIDKAFDYLYVTDLL